MRTVRQRKLLAGVVQLSIRYDDWSALSASRKLPQATAADDEVFSVILHLLEQLYRRRVALRHVGIVLSHFQRAQATPELFDPAEQLRRRSLYRTLDAIRDRWGHAAVVTGQSIELLGRLQRNDYGFILRTPSLTK